MFPALLCRWITAFAALLFFMVPLHAGDLELKETEDEILVTLRGKPVLNYIKTEKPAPDGIDPLFRRSGYIHPVHTPTGQEITGDFPADHAHQHALYFAWTKASYDGKKADFWNQADGLGRIEFREVVDLKREDSKVSFSVRHAFMVPRDGKHIDVLDEVWTVTVHQTPEDHFLFEIESVQQCATDKPLVLPKYHYGGMAFRGNVEWFMEKDALRFLTSEGKGRLDGNHSRPDWVVLSGTIDGQKASVTVFCHPANFRAPQAVRIHPEKPYFCFAPMVQGPFKIEPGEEFVSKYRYLVTSDVADRDKIERAWKDYAKVGE